MNQTLMNQNIINFVKPAMDLFSVGCVIGELFIEESLFDLSALLSYKSKGSRSPTNRKAATSQIESDLEDKLKELPFYENNKLKKVNTIEIKEIRDLIFNLIDLNPSVRKDCAKHLKELFELGVMPKYFFYLFNYLSNLNPLSPDEKILKLDRDFEQLSEQILEEDCNGFLIIITNVLSCYRALIHSYARITGLNLMVRVVAKVDGNDALKSNIILERILPYVMNTISKDTCPKVKSHSIYCLTQLLNQVEIVTVSDKNVFPDYILPALHKIVQDEYALVRTTLAKHLPSLSRIALKFLTICPATAKPETSSGDAEEIAEGSQKSAAAIYNKELKALQNSFQFISYGILTDKEISVRVEMMLNEDLVELCTFFGKQKTNEVIFSHLITFLNERIDFELRLAFYQCIKPIAAYLGIQSSPVIKPLLQQGFTDAEETVINQSVLTSAYLCNSQLMTKKTALDLVADAIPLLVHPNLSIRHSMIELIVNCSQMLSQAELNCRLLPMVKPFLRPDEKENLLYLSNTVADTSLLLDSLVPPVPRVIYDLILNKINAAYILECFFETLEKYQHLNKPPPSHLSETILNVSALDTHLSGYQSQLINSSTPSNMSVCSFGNSGANQQHQAAASSLNVFLELLVEEGLDEEVKFKLLKISGLMIKIYKSIKAAKSFINSSQQQARTPSSLPKPLSPGAAGSSSLQSRLVNSDSQRFDDLKQVRKDNKRLYSLNLLNQKYLLSSNDWHIPSMVNSTATAAANIESFTMHHEEFEEAREAKENMSEQEVASRGEQANNAIEEYSVELGCDQSSTKGEPHITCPPCVFELQSLFKHRQRKFGEFFYKISEFDKNGEASTLIGDQSTSMNSSATTIISSDFQGSSPAHSGGEQPLHSLQDGHYALANCRPKGKLIANLTEHRKAISKVLTIGNSLFFSCSHDGTIKLWDGNKMNQGTCLVNRSKQTFRMHEKNGASSGASAANGEWFQGMCYSSGKELLIGHSNKANLYVVKVDGSSSKMTLYQTVNDFCKNAMFVNPQSSWNKGVFLKGYRPSTANLLSECSTSNQNSKLVVQNYSITDISCNSPFVFVCSFSNSCVKAFDLRLPLTKSIWTMNTNPNEGLITCLAEGDSCLFAGTSYGHIATFDTRFQLRSSTMSYSVQRRIRRLLYTPKGLYAAVEGYNEISLWDCESGSRTKTMWASNAPPLSNKISTNSVYGLVSANYAGGDFSGLLSCGSDARIRYWDLAEPQKSYIVVDSFFRNHSSTAGSSASNVSTVSGGTPANYPTNRNSHVSYMSKILEGMQLIQEYDHEMQSPSGGQPTAGPKEASSYSPPNSYNNWDPQDISPAHKNIITDLVWLNKSGLLVSASRDGCIKLWK